MTGITPTDTLGYNPYQAYNQYYYYPAPQYAVQAQVPYPQVVTIPQGVQNQQAPKEDEVVKTNKNLTTFEASKEIQKEKKSHGKAWAVLGTLTAIGLACLGKKAYNKGFSELVGTARIKSGLRTMKNEFVEKCKPLCKKVGDLWNKGVNWFKGLKPVETPPAVA